MCRETGRVSFDWNGYGTGVQSVTGYTIGSCGGDSVTAIARDSKIVLDVLWNYWMFNFVVENESGVVTPTTETTFVLANLGDVAFE